MPDLKSRHSVFHTMSQEERRRALESSSWPDLDWSCQYVHISEYHEFDKDIDRDARAGYLSVLVEEGVPE